MEFHQDGNVNERKEGANKKTEEMWRKQIADCEIDANNMQMMQEMKHAGEAKASVTQ